MEEKKKRKRGILPGARTLKWLREQGYIAGMVEKWNPFARIRQDFLGFADILTFRPGRLGVIAIQATTMANINARREKILGIPEARAWVNSHNYIWVVGWAKRGDRGKRKLWTHKKIEIKPDDFY